MRTPKFPLRLVSTWLSLFSETKPRVIAAMLVDVTSECCVQRVFCKTWTGLSAGTLANSAGSDQMLQNAASDQEIKG